MVRVKQQKQLPEVRHAHYEPTASGDKTIEEILDYWDRAERDDRRAVAPTAIELSGRGRPLDVP
ncbi:MAG TPA: hypothetical protein VKM54_22365 [Myxococcota bacterium]|nr:hypothetical protein [Myxococcota bacterium]